MMFGFRDAFDYFQCSHCGCLQISKFPADISRYYPDDYCAQKPLPYTPKLRSLAVSLRDKYALSGKGLVGKFLHGRHPNPILSLLSHLPLSKKSSILDVGCGSGFLLHSLRRLGFKNLQGIDPFNKNDIECADGIHIYKKHIHDVVGLWDIIMFHHSFEHVPDPAETLQTVAGLLPVGGHCLIRIPIVSSYAWEQYGINWAQLDAPRHYFLHSIKSMQFLARLAGLELYDTRYDSSHQQLIACELYQRDISLQEYGSYSPEQRDSIFTPKEIAAFVALALDLNESRQGDQAAFYLRK